MAEELRDEDGRSWTFCLMLVICLASRIVSLGLRQFDNVHREVNVSRIEVD